jgi:tetratricopeptide (TPR) repeat protein
VSPFGKGVLIVASLVLCLWPAEGFADRAQARALTAEGQNQAEQGFREQALLLYEKAIGSDPDYHPSYELAIPLWMRFGKLGTAKTSLESLTLRCSECAFAWYALGALYRKAGRFDLAVLAYEFYLAKRPSDTDAYFGLSMALGALKDKQAAPVLRRYLRMESRPERDAYRKQAQRLLTSITGQEEPAPLRAGHPVVPADKRSEALAGIRLLIENGQLVSAESLLNQRHPTSAAVMELRAMIAEARGQRFPAASFRALAWLWQ